MWPFKRRPPVLNEEDKSMQSAKESAAAADRALTAAKEQGQRSDSLVETIRRIREVNHLSELFGQEGIPRG